MELGIVILICILVIILTLLVLVIIQNRNVRAENKAELIDLRNNKQELSVNIIELKKTLEFSNISLNDKEKDIKDLNLKVESLLSANQLKEKQNNDLDRNLNIVQEKFNNISKELNEKESILTSLRQEIEILRQEKIELSSNLSTEKEKNINLEKSFNDYKQSFEQLNKQNEEHIQNLTNKILDDKTKKFSEINTKELEIILQPLKDRIVDFNKKIEDSNDKQTKLHTALETQIKTMVSQTKSIGEDAIKLTNALKGENKRAGNWGEHILETILKNSGLLKGIHYQAQQNIIDEDNKRLIPDFVVYLPTEDEQNTIIIDSKVSLVAYERYFNANTEEEQNIALQEHLKSVKNHIDELANKNYEQKFKGSLDFIFMFIPIEPAYLVAVQSDIMLWEYAYKKKIILISATNMISSLRLIADLWKIDTRNKEAQAMAEICGGIYDKLLGFLETFESIGDSVKRIYEQYDKAKGKLSEGNGNIIKRLETLKQKGINSKSKKSIPKSFES